jgi:long-chain acyl-CoA synthetase
MEGYGLTETSPVTTMMPLEGTYKIGSIGLPIPGVEVRIVDYEDREVPVNQIGEIVVRGPNVMKGYYNRPEETNWVMRNGWFHTGDLAYMDSSGYLFIVDRKKDLVIRGGLNIYPKEIEEVLYSHPSVFDAAVIGVPDPIMGEEVMAFVLLREGVNVTPEEIREFCSKKLARYKIPKHIRFVENLPKTTTGKLLKKELQKMI